MSSSKHMYTMACVWWWWWWGFVDQTCETVYDDNLCLVTPHPLLRPHRLEGNTITRPVRDAPAVT